MLTQEGVTTIRKEGNGGMGKVTRYSYVQIESCNKVNQPVAKAGAKRPSFATGHFLMALNFYNKELDAKKKKVVVFTIAEQNDDESELDARFNQEAPLGTQPVAVQSRRSNVTIMGLVHEKEGMAPLEFSVIYLIQRQIPIYWQQFFEKSLQLQKAGQDRIEDCYQYHAFVLKSNRFF